MSSRTAILALACALAQCGADEANEISAAPDAQVDAAADRAIDSAEPDSHATDAPLESDAADALAEADAPLDGQTGADCRQNNYCPSTTIAPACDPATGRCVECIDNSTCTGNTGICDVERQLCTCSAGLTECVTAWTTKGRMCLDFTWTGQACGDCAHECGGGEWCQSGACKCMQGFTPCPGGCLNLDADVDNCGACAKACASGERCEAGQCQTGTACVGADLTTCNMGPRSSCRDLPNDPTSCGQCLRACSGPLECFDSECRRGWPASKCIACPCTECDTNPFTAQPQAPHCLPPRAAGAPPRCVE